MALTQVSTDGIKNGTITGSDLATNVDLVDNQKLRLGTGNDLQIYHDGSNSYIKDDGTGAVILQTNKLQIQNTAAGEDLAKFTQNAAVELYYDNSKKFETTSDGVKISGAEGVEAILTFEPDEGDNASDKFRFRASDSAGFFLENGSSNDTSIKANFNGSVELYHANSKKLNTNANGVHITDTLTFANTGDSVLLADDQKVSCGNGGDLKIFHDGSDSFIVDQGTGRLNIRTNGDSIKLQNTDGGTEAMGIFNSNGSVELYHNGSKKFETTSGGVEITDNLNMSGGHIFLADDFKLNAGTGDDLQIYHDGSNSFIKEDGTGLLKILTNGLEIKNVADNTFSAFFGTSGASELYFNGSKTFETINSGVLVTGTLKINDGSSSTNRIAIGNSGDLIIYHDGNNSFIENAGTGSLNLYGDEVNILNKARSEFKAKFITDGAVELFYDNTKRFETTSTGAAVNGAFYIGPPAGADKDLVINKEGTGTLVRFRTTGTTRGTITSNGSTVAYNTSASDRSMKKNFEDWTEDTLALFKNINPQKFNFLDQEDGTEKDKGFIAQDLVASFPEAYQKNDDNKYMFNPGGMVVYLMKAIQELEAEVAALKAA